MPRNEKQPEKIAEERQELRDELDGENLPKFPMDIPLQLEEAESSMALRMNALEIYL